MFKWLLKLIKKIMAQFTTTNLAGVSVAPNSIGDITLSVNGDSELLLLPNYFTTDTVPPYGHPQNAAPYKLKIVTTPSTGRLEFGNVVLNPGNELEISDIIPYNLKYIPDAAILTEHSDSFTFAISDIDSEQFFGTGTVFINVLSQPNLPPVIGDGSATIAYGETKVFTPADFTTNTTPQYWDPEGDSPALLKILDLPTSGELLLDGIPVVVNQIISFADIAGGSFTQVGDPLDTTSYDMVFSFAIADSGSLIFVE